VDDETCVILDELDSDDVGLLILEQVLSEDIGSLGVSLTPLFSFGIE